MYYNSDLPGGMTFLKSPFRVSGTELYSIHLTTVIYLTRMLHISICFVFVSFFTDVYGNFGLLGEWTVHHSKAV